MKQQTPVEWLESTAEKRKEDYPNETAYWHLIKLVNDFEEAKELEQKHLRDNLERLVQEIKDYTRESRNILGFDDREPSEIVDIFLGKNEQKH